MIFVKENPLSISDDAAFAALPTTGFRRVTDGSALPLVVALAPPQRELPSLVLVKYGASLGQKFPLLKSVGDRHVLEIAPLSPFGGKIHFPRSPR
jgi:hypothetical protein